MIALKTSLFEHQKQAVNKLRNIRVGALFMEMGTGKSRAALELIALRKQKISNIIWFCPFSIKHALAEEIRKHLSAGQDFLHIFSDKTSLDNIPQNGLHIVGIESVSNSNNVVFCLHKIINNKTQINAYTNHGNQQRHQRSHGLNHPP